MRYWRGPDWRWCWWKPGSWPGCRGGRSPTGWTVSGFSDCINVSNVCIVGCAFCGFGQSRRSPDAYEHSEPEFAQRVHEAVAAGATELCIQSGIHPDWGLEDYEHWLRFAKQLAPQLHLHAYSPMEIAHMCDVSGLLPRAVFARLREAGLGSTPGTAAEVLHDGVRERISPNKLPVARWVEIIE